MKNAVKNLMARKLVTVRDIENIMAARRLMSEKRIRHLPVLNADDVVIGIVSSKDLALSTEFPHIRVQHVMSTPVEYIREKSPVKDAIFRMLDKKISCLMVVDEDQEAVGIVTSDDLLLYFSEVLTQLEDGKSSWTDAVKTTVGQLANQLAAMGI